MANMVVTYVSDIPLGARLDFCQHMDFHESWVQLAGHIGFTQMEVEMMRRQVHQGKSPTDALLVKWSHRNATTLQLLEHLHAMGADSIQAIKLLRSSVPDEAYHTAMEALGVPMDER